MDGPWHLFFTTIVWYGNSFDSVEVCSEIIKQPPKIYFRNGLECNLHLCGEEKYLTCKCCPYKFDFKNADEVDCDVCDEDNQLFSEPLL